LTDDFPLVSVLSTVVQKWRDTNPPYQGASETTKRLLNFWFNEEHYLADDVSFEFWKCQKEAIETLVYVYEICGYTDFVSLVQGLNVSILFDPLQYKWNKYAFKMATCSGKTFLMAMVIIWQFFNRLYKTDNGRRYSSNFLMIAPNLIVLDRLQTSFADGKIFSEFPFIPPEFEPDFDFQLILQSADIVPHSNCILHLTNWQQFQQRQEPSGNPIEGLMSRAPVKGEESQSRTPLLQTLSKSRDIIVLNDEAHHVYTDELIWGEFISKLNDSLKTSIGSGLLMQLDFSATPQYPMSKVLYFPHIIYNYSLRDAITDRIVKDPIIGIIEGAPEPISHDFVEKNKLQIDTGLRELQRMRWIYRKTKKPVLFVMCDSVPNADRVARYLELRKGLNGKVLVIHTDKEGNITKNQLPELRDAAKNIDTNQYEVIVSVMMLKEGWDVRNVTCIVPLRSYTSEILVEQTLGRGLRRMFPENDDLNEQLVVIEHPRFRQLWESEVRNAGLRIDIRPIKKIAEAPNTDKHFEYLSYMATAILSKIGFTSQFSELVPILRSYIEKYFFLKPVNIEGSDTVKKLNDPIVRVKLRDTFLEVLNKLSKTQADLTLVSYYKLSETKTLFTSEEVYAPKKSVFDYLPYPKRSHYERDFMGFLDAPKNKQVLAYTKVLMRFPIRISYYDEDGFIRHYIPDFIVKTKSTNFIIETKGVGWEEMTSAKLKQKAAKGWCNKVTKITKKDWQYVKIVENEFQQYSSYDLIRLVRSISN
jgi:type III restriction enzyme